MVCFESQTVTASNKFIYETNCHSSVNNVFLRANFSFTAMSSGLKLKLGKLLTAKNELFENGKWPILLWKKKIRTPHLQIRQRI